MTRPRLARTALMLALLAPAAVHAQAALPDLEGLCGASSSYDLTLDGERLLFERAAPTPQRPTGDGT